MREEKKAEKRQELVGVCLDCFVEKGLTVATTKDLCKAAKLQNGGIYYYFSTKEEIVLACAEEAISRIEKAAFAIVLEDISDIKSMMDHLGELADKMSPTMRFLVSVCVSREYGEKVKPSVPDGMVVCPECNKTVVKGRFCPECGHKFVTICPKCKSELPEGAKFCLECGEKI